MVGHRHLAHRHRRLPALRRPVHGHQLYADATLQVFFIVTSVIGWWQWRRDAQAAIAVASKPARAPLRWPHWALLLAGGVVVTLGYGALLLHWGRRGGTSPGPPACMTAPAPRHRLGLVAGKFSPLHRGHEHLITQALAACEQVAVVGYSQPAFAG